jgi:glycosyltransferase involved in cell wall biosynthesis
MTFSSDNPRHPRPDSLSLAADAVAELKRLAKRREELDLDIRVTREHVDDIRGSRSWRALEIYRRARVRAGLSGASGAALHAAWRARRSKRTVATRVRTTSLGVNVSGYLDTESGMGEAARASIRALTAAGVPVALNNVLSKLRAGDVTYRDDFRDDNPHPFNLVHLNADNMPAFSARRGRVYFKDRYTIGYWFWELSIFRDEWVPFAGYVDEVWVATQFVREAVAAKCAIPVRRMRLPVVLPPLPARGRAHFGIPDGPTAFLYVFDVSSQTERKNPLAAIRAFRKAALPREKAILVLKFGNPEYDRAGVRRLHEEAAGLNVVMLDGYLDRPDLAALLNAADCYLSPHRAEGFGLTLLESMALGKPVIATAYSGNMDFMTPENSFPLDFTLVSLTRDYGPYMRGAVWAEPDIDQAADLIRRVAAAPAEAVARGSVARRMVEDLYSAAATGAAMRARLDAIRGGRRETDRTGEDTAA